MTVRLYHNPHSRAAMMQWLLEEIGCPYELVPVQYDDGSMREASFLKLNPMGKIPVLVDGDTVVTETVAIALYLADKFKTPNDLAPAIHDAARGDYLRWIAFQSGAVEPAMMQAGAKFEAKRESAGWGSVELVVDVLEQRVSAASPWLLGETFSAADVVLGGALSWAVGWKLFPARPGFTSYLERLTDRPAYKRVFANQ